MAGQPSSNCQDAEAEQLLDWRPQAGGLGRGRRLLAAAVGLGGASGLAWIAGLGGGRAPVRHPQDILQSEADFAKTIQLFGSADTGRSAFMDGPYEVTKARAMGLLPEDNYPNTTDEAKLMAYWVKEAKHVRQIEARHEKMYRLDNRTEEYVKVSECAVSTGNLLLKIASSMLNLVALIHICPKINSFTPEMLEKRKRVAEMLNNDERRKNRKNGRRLHAGLEVSVGQIITSREQAVMGCAANIQGLISGLAACIQFASCIAGTCPSNLPPQEARTALCSNAVSVTISGITKSSASASDVKYQCRDPLNTSYTEAINPKQQATVTTACVLNVAQAITHMAQVGLSVDNLAKYCHRPEMFKDRFAEAACVGAVGCQFVQIGSVVTYLSAAVNGCGESLLVPYSCVNRVAAIVAGLAGIVEGAGKMIVGCVPGPETTTTQKPGEAAGVGEARGRF